MTLKLLAAAAALVITSCVTTPEAPTPSIPVEKREVTSPADQTLREKVTTIALESECARTAHDVQGTPPKSFLRGISLSFARAICNADSEAVKIASQPVGDAKSDALAHYGLKPATAAERLQTVYSLLLGSAARESSWRWCIGKDANASNSSAETCEAGLYQTSYNSRSAHPVLPLLFAQFQRSSAGCFASEYKGATKCTAANLKNWGEGPGVEFQRLTKECPGFASEYHAVMVRVRRTHYGPINIKKSQVKPACTAMFARIQEAVAADQRICGAL